ncbi:hypothetical protein FHU38_003379 [Saccharomonospora amisosensis]|uniref:Transposase n=1 Tax=Saccharomonospora amisosensis TaxID=1128677 RepID=A0A7X5URZ8_9PSEU|nr:hypothetical protein [Saccharomonospora amisosensis]NIJ13035.1 hypothetical protein [Saccharomonospora amisosensis]
MHAAQRETRHPITTILLAGQDTSAKAIAVDGKTLRGTCDGIGQRGVHPLAAMTHESAIVLAQPEVGRNTHEIACFRPLSILDINTTGVVVTADVVHALRLTWDQTLHATDPSVP